MNDFQKSLDRYLTSEPEDHYSIWYEKIFEFMTQEFYDKHEKEIETDLSPMDKMIHSFYNDDLSPKQAAEKLESIYE